MAGISAEFHSNNAARTKARINRLRLTGYQRTNPSGRVEYSLDGRHFHPGVNNNTDEPLQSEVRIYSPQLNIQ